MIYRKHKKSLTYVAPVTESESSFRVTDADYVGPDPFATFDEFVIDPNATAELERVNKNRVKGGRAKKPHHKRGRWTPEHTRAFHAQFVDRNPGKSPREVIGASFTAATAKGYPMSRDTYKADILSGKS